MKVLLPMLIAFAATTASYALDHNHTKWGTVLKNFQNPEGLVDYAGLKSAAKDPNHEFNAYLKELSSVSFKDYEKFTREEKMAFLINAYNAYTFKLIINHYPLESIRDIGGIFSSPWKKKFFKILDGKLQSLDPIEHDWLRPMFKDYRIHAAVNCASISCPPLRNEPFVPTKLEAQLADQMKFWMNDTTRNRYNAAKGEIFLSKIFDWYGKDFEKWGGGIKAVVNKYGPPSAQEALKNGGDIDFLDYDWGLNEFKRQPKQG